MLTKSSENWREFKTSNLTNRYFKISATENNNLKIGPWYSNVFPTLGALPSLGS
jgi:hypothetical protein